MNSDLFKTLKVQKLTDEHITFQVYQLLRALKVYKSIYTHYISLTVLLLLLFAVHTFSWHHT